MLTSPDLFPKILDCLDWPSKGQAACVCRRWRLLAGLAEASLSAGWLTWQQPWPPKGPVLRHVQKCKLVICTDRLYLVNFNSPHLPALTAVHIEARLTTTRGKYYTIYWNNATVRDLCVTVLRSKRHCLAHGTCMKYNFLALVVASSCLETLCMRAVVAETSLLMYRGLDPMTSMDEPLGVYLDLQLLSVPELRQLLVCSQGVKVSRLGAGDCPTVSFSGLKAGFLTDYVSMTIKPDYEWGLGHDNAKLQDTFLLCEAIDPPQLRGSLRLASDNHTLQLLQTFLDNDCYP